MHVCGLIFLDPTTMPDGYTYEAFKAHLEDRVSDVPEFTRRLRWDPLDMAHPIWVAAQHFDISPHVHRRAPPPPDGQSHGVKQSGPPRGDTPARIRTMRHKWG